MIAFVDLAMVGEGCGLARSKAEHLYARFITSKPGQLFLVSYNSDQHWMLIVVEQEKEKVYYMDPLRRRLPIASAEWKSVINSVIAEYNTEKGRPSLNAVAWKNLGGVPHQPDHIQCGFYVMRFSNSPESPLPLGSRRTRPLLPSRRKFPISSDSSSLAFSPSRRSSLSPDPVASLAPPPVRPLASLPPPPVRPLSKSTVFR
ncbi:hypothetical protein ACLB2K_040409 [Fragaria x ananassa]